MCNKKFDSWLTNTKVMSKIFIFYRQIARKGSNYFPGKFLKPYAQNQHQMSQKTINIFARLSPLSMQNPFQIIFGIKLMIFKTFAAHITTNLVPNIVEKKFCLPPN